MDGANKKSKTSDNLPVSAVILDNQRYLLASVQFITKIKYYIFKENQNLLMNAQRKKRMFTNILQKLKLFANWRPWPEKLELIDGLVQDRFTLLDAIQTSFRADGVLTSGRIDELKEDLLSFFPETVVQLYQNRSNPTDDGDIILNEVAL